MRGLDTTIIKKVCCSEGPSTDAFVTEIATISLRPKDLECNSVVFFEFHHQISSQMQTLPIKVCCPDMVSDNERSLN